MITNEIARRMGTELKPMKREFRGADGKKLQIDIEHIYLLFQHGGNRLEAKRIF